MVNKFLHGFAACAFLLLFASSTVLAQAGKAPQTAPAPTIQKAPFCDEVKKQMYQALEDQASVEGRTMYRCFECNVRATNTKRCEPLVAQPNKKMATKPVFEIGSDVPLAQNPFMFEIVQTPCLGGGITLEVIIPGLNSEETTSGRFKPAPNDFTYLWELDGGKGGHDFKVDCFTGNKAKVRVRQGSTGASVEKTVHLASPPPTQAKPSATPEAVPSLVAAYAKTGCFGNCPVFQVYFFSNGLVQWRGLANVKDMGARETQIQNPGLLTAIEEKAKVARFFSLNDRYPESQIWDIPATVTYVSINGQHKEVTNFTGAPKNLMDFEKFMDESVRSLGWDTSAAPKGSINQAAPSVNEVKH